MYSEVQREIAIDEELDGLIDKFINVHLPKYRGCSKHTIKSYETAICQFLSWVSDIGGSISQESKSVGVLDFNRNQITEWLYFIEERGCCAATRNQRLAALRSFFLFVTDQNTAYMENYYSIERIRWKKTPTPSKDFLDEEELKCIMNCIEGRTDTAIKHYMLLCVLYESGARVHELINMRAENITHGKVSYIKILGKGQKFRNVYISTNISLLIKEYCRRFEIKRGYLFTNSSGKPLSEAGVNFIIKKYVNMAAEKMPSLYGKKVTAHTLRRSKATHMLQNNMNLVVIQHFLGHESLKTTEQYLDIGIRDMVNAVNISQTARYTTYQFWNDCYWREVSEEEQKQPLLC